MALLDEPVKRLLTEGRNIAHLGTLMPDGAPQVTPVWIDYDGRHIIVNTAEGRLKWRNLRRDPRVAVSLIDQENPYVRATIRGRVAEITREGADAQIDRMAKKYLGKDVYPNRRPGEQRVLIKIEAERVSSNMV